MAILLVICIILLLLTVTIVSRIRELKKIEYKMPEVLSGKKVLVIYYSNGRNTEIIGENIRSITGGDIKEIQLVENYPNNIFKMSKLVRKQMKESFLPQIEDIDISNYDVIFVGSPIWNFSVSLPVKTFLKNNNFENKTIIPFFTFSGGADRNKVIDEIQNVSSVKDIKKPLFMFENGIFLVKEQIIKWLNNV